MRKTKFINSIITKSFIVIITINVVIATISLIIQNFEMEEIYYHLRVDTIENDIEAFEDNLKSSSNETLANDSLATNFYNEHNASVVLLNDDLNIYGSSIFNDFNYVMVKRENDQYSKVLIDYLFDENGKSVHQQLNENTGSEISIRGIHIKGTDYVDAVEIEIDNHVYTNYKAYWEWEETYAAKEDEIQEFFQANVIDVQFKQSSENQLETQSRRLWNIIKQYIYTDMSEQELIQLADQNGETYFEDVDSKLKVYYKIGYVKNDEDEYVFYAMLFTLENVQTIFRALNNFYMIQYLITTLIVILAGLFFARKFKKPMTQLNDYAKHIAAADFETQLHIVSNDETGELCDSLNEISRNLKVKMDELSDEALRKEKEEKRMRMLLASLSHEFKTPLGIIAGFVQMRKDSIKPEKADYHYMVIEDEISRLNSLVLETIELTNYESGTVKTEFMSFRIKKCVHNISRKLSNDARKKNIEIKIDGQETFVIGDVKKIEQVLLNLISNAIKYSYDYEDITIILEVKKEDLYVYIDNTGTAISEEELAHIWDAFYRIETSRNRSSGGSGLGLAIVNNILELHNSDRGIINTSNGIRAYFSLAVDKKET
ncbi:HAMP domain-containing sensor histidine kinase [Vallitalea okinawensis]|uniref:HAMP domain-containing sensor histidine kinase n=1 Tax=Vallitalea okinawensis TaxID=2078660 RepID=UPI000CFB12C8|nr:HAMP domain-containing sensor histidine kinase [Vallitalea okinawensis]